MPPEPDFYTANLALLKQNHPHIFATISSREITPTGEVLLSENDQDDLSSNRAGRLTTSDDTATPEDDTEAFLNLVPPGANGVVVLFGLGLGHAAIALLQERPTVPYLAIFEYDPEVFLQTLRRVDLAKLLSSPKVLLSVGPEADIDVLKPTSRALQLESIYTLRHLPAYAAQEGYHKLEAMVMEHLSSLNVGGATNVHFGKLFTSNRFHHLSAIHHQYLIEAIENAYENVPAIVVAGGPSLDKNIHLLREAQGKAVILGVDSVLPSLLKAGVSPDFISSIDPQDLTYEKLANASLGCLNAPLICMPWVSPKVPKTFPASTVFWTFSAKPIEAWLNHLLGGDTLTGGAGTVAHLNMLAAIIMGCSPIILVGQDLAFTPGRSSHTRNAFLTHDNKASSHQEDDHLFTTAAWGGGEIKTTRDFFGMKRFFERMMEDSPRTYINATEGGVHLEGAEDIPLQIALDRYCQRPHHIAETLQNRCAQASRPNIDKLLQEFQSLSITIDSLLTLIEKTDRTTQTAIRELAVAGKKKKKMQTFSDLPQSLRKKIQEIEKAHKNIDDYNNLWKITEELTLEGLRESERLRHEFSPLADSPATYLKWLHLNLKRCERINTARTETLTYFKKELDKVLTHHASERQLMEKIEQAGENAVLLSSLSELYMATKDTTLAEPVLTKLASMPPVAAETRFQQGVIALERAEYEQGDRYLSEAMRIDPEYETRVATLRQKLGDRYLNHAIFYRRHSLPTMQRLLLKGLRYCPDHEQITSTLLDLFRQALQEILAARQSGNIIKASRLIADWITDLNNNPALAAAIGHDTLAPMLFQHGKLLAEQGMDSEAIDHLRKAVALVPHSAQTHLLLMELLFARQQFQEGIDHLQKAVAIDRKYASYWERIGDTLAGTGRHEDAISAYEQCFLALPNLLDLLKKIGDCYLASNQLEAARSAYEQYKEALEK